MLVRISSHPWFALCILVFAAAYFCIRILPAWQRTERDSWRKICDSSSLQRTAKGFCYTCQGTSHTFLNPLYGGQP